MKYVAIVKAVGDLDKIPTEHTTSHPEYPIEVREFDSLDEALLAHAGRPVMTVDEYNGFKRAMNLRHGPIVPPGALLPKSISGFPIIQPKRPWWKFWSKP